jgi:hypothetical protein
MGGEYNLISLFPVVSFEFEWQNTVHKFEEEKRKRQSRGLYFPEATQSNV